MKRLFDVLLSLILLSVLWPLILLLALLILITTKESPFFLQTRVGKRERGFKIYKFRTMYANKVGGHLTVGEDDRITPIGKWLRNTKLDEIPQLFNVLIGQMSFVGPRPELAYYVKFYTSNQRKVFTVRPGVTSLASVKYKNESELLGAQENPEEYYIKVILQDKLSIELEYFSKRTLLSDITILLKTVKILF